MRRPGPSRVRSSCTGRRCGRSTARFRFVSRCSDRETRRNGFGRSTSRFPGAPSKGTAVRARARRATCRSKFQRTGRSSSSFVPRPRRGRPRRGHASDDRSSRMPTSVSRGGASRRPRWATFESMRPRRAARSRLRIRSRSTCGFPRSRVVRPGRVRSGSKAERARKDLRFAFPRRSPWDRPAWPSFG